MSENKALDQALKEILPHLRDVSLRDGIQSWDGNRWRIDDIVPVAQEINQLALTVEKELGVKMAPAEVWGGGQVFQPAKFLNEDPFENLEKLKTAMPDMELQSLYRGRQGYAFSPLSDEVQQAAIKESADRGIHVFRIFDMMNDTQNVETGIKAVNEYKQSHPGSHVCAEGAVSYISEPDGPRVWTLDDYADYAVKLAKMGADEIVVKNYAGVGGNEMVPLIHTIRAKLKEASHEAGFERLAGMNVNLHMHGEHSKLFAEVLDAENGANKVDVAIGKLSDGPAHTNIRSVIMKMLEDRGLTDEQAIRAHPVMQQLAKVEEKIHEVVERTQEMPGGKANSFENTRGPLKNIDPADIENYRVAQGAFSDLAARVKGQDPKLFGQTLEKAAELWEKAGRFNTVTPGAKIIIDQALKFKAVEMLGRKPTMSDYDDAFIKVVTGRFGRNQGMEKGIGDVAWRDALLMFKALEKLNEASAAGKLSATDYSLIAVQASFGSPEQSLRLKGKISGGVSSASVDLKNPQLEEILKTNIPNEAGATTIERFRKALLHSNIQPQLKDAVLFELSTGRSPTPVTGLAEGQRVVEKLQKQGIETRSYDPLLVMLLRNGDDNVYTKLRGSLGKHTDKVISPPPSHTPDAPAK